MNDSSTTMKDLNETNLHVHGRIKTALFVDFDNVFGGLMEFDRHAALKLVQEPGEWLKSLAKQSLPDTIQRNILIRRAYMNPAGFIPDRELGNNNGNLFFSKFRPYFTQSGFEVVDCPALTVGQKNAADIRIVIDVLQSLDSKTRYDEFVIVSSDSDFTPLLHCLRANDRRTMIISAGQAASAYRNVADEFIDATDLVYMLSNEDTTKTGGDQPSIATSGFVSNQSLHDMRSAVEGYISESSVPVLLSELGIKLREDFRQSIEQSDWHGHGGLGDFLRATMPHLHLRGHYIWDPKRHKEPQQPVNLQRQIDLPESVRKICRVTDLPRISAKDWGALFEKLALFSSSEEFNLTKCTAWVRDRLADEDVQIGRSHVGWVVRHSLYGGVRLTEKPLPTADEIRNALISSVTSRAHALAMDLTESDEVELRNWLGGTQSE